MSRFMPVASFLRWSARGIAMVTLHAMLVGGAAAQDEPPLAFDGGPYAGTVGIAVGFNGLGSFDADGDALQFAWDFGDGSTGSGATPTHVYAAAATYVVKLTVTANGLSSSDETVAVISELLAARAFVFHQEVTKLSSPKPSTVRIESGGGFMLWDVVPTEVWMRSTGTGGVEAIRAIPSSVVTDGDRDRNGVAELKASFAKVDLRRLFSGLGGGTAAVRIQGRLRSGAWFSADLGFPLSGSTATVQARLANDPALGTAVLELAGADAVALRIRVFDVHGRVLRSLTGSGSARQSFDLARAVRESGGGGGVYFYRIEDEQGAHNGRFVLLK